MGVSNFDAAVARIQAQVEEAKREAEEQVEAQAANDAALREEASRRAKALLEALKQHDRLQAIADTAFLVAAADGTLSDNERQKVCQGLRRAMGDALEATTLDELLQTSQARHDDQGRDGLAGNVASTLPDPDDRRAAFLVAASTAWEDGGVGAKEGLALQALSRAFDIPMNEMHKLLGAAKQS